MKKCTVLFSIILSMLVFVSSSSTSLSDDNWETVTYPQNSGAMSLFVTSNNTLLAGGGQNIMWSSDMGISWHDISISSGWAHSIFDFEENSNGDVLSAAASGVFISTNDGRNWSMLRDDNMVRYIQVDELDNIYITSQSNGLKLMMSNNNGNSWIDITPGNVEIVFLVPKVVNSGLILLSTGSELMYTTDMGQTWEKAGDENVHYNFNSMVYSDNKYVASSFYQNSYNGIFESSDGMTWQKIETDPSVLDFRWIENNPYTGELYGFISGDGIYISNDGGTSWTKYHEGIQGSEYIYDMACSENNYIFASSSENRLYRKSSNTSSVEDNAIGYEAEIFISPNPAQDYINIEILNKKNSQYTIEIIDINGNIVESQYELSSDNQLFQISLDNVFSGYYYVKIQSNNTIEFKPVTIIK